MEDIEAQFFIYNLVPVPHPLPPPWKILQGFFIFTFQTLYRGVFWRVTFHYFAFAVDESFQSGDLSLLTVGNIPLILSFLSLWNFC